MEPHLLARTVGGVGRLTINRPEQRNAMSPEMLELLFKNLREMDADPAIGAIVLDGAGGNFIAGGDVKSWAKLKTMAPAERGEDFRGRMGGSLPVIELLGSLETPLIVALRGYSAGAGLGLLLAGDFVLADDTTKLIFANIRMALIPDLGITYYLPRIVGERRALRLTLLGEQLDAQQAKALGIIDEVVAPDDLEAAIDSLTAQLIAAPAKAVARTKKLLRLSGIRTLHDQLVAENEGVISCVQEPDFIEAITAFAERRPAKFSRG